LLVTLRPGTALRGKEYANWPNIAKQLTQPYADVQALKTTPEDYGRSAAQLVNANIFKTS
jgi:hypothetical protein